MSTAPKTTELHAEALPPETQTPPPKGKPGRKRDHTRDPEILDAAIAVLAETGYDGMTIDMVAARAKAGKATLYRRWPSKAELVLDAVACMKKADAESLALPDTGTLRGDLLAMVKDHSHADAQNKLHIMAGMMSMLSRRPELMESAISAIVEPRLAINKLFLERAIERGEIPADSDVEHLASLSPAMAAYRVLVQKQPVDRAFLLKVIDTVVMPAVGLSVETPSAHSKTATKENVS